MSGDRRDKKIARTQNMMAMGIALMVLSVQISPVSNMAWTTIRFISLVAGISAFAYGLIRFQYI